jgi:predicted transcriptional regulator
MYYSGAMKTAKEEAIELIQRLPDEASFETIVAELHFMLRVVRGLRQVERGELVSHEEVKGSVTEWLESIGH